MNTTAKFNLGDTVFFKYLNPKSGKLEFLYGEVTYVTLRKDKVPEYNVNFFSEILNSNYDCLFNESSLFASYYDILMDTYNLVNGLRIDYELDSTRIG